MQTTEMHIVISIYDFKHWLDSSRNTYLSFMNWSILFKKPTETGSSIFLPTIDLFVN